MIKKIHILTMFLTILLLAGCSANTLAFTPDEISQRIEHQHQRITVGINEGRLTRHEADIVLDNLDWIETTFQRMTRDGMLTPPERERLEAMLDRNSRMINREIRNFENVYGPNFQERIHAQQQRINDGVAKGLLTRHEAEIVQGNLDWIRETLARMTQEGRLRAGEMRRLEEMLEQNRELIFKEKTNQNYYIFRDRYRDFR